MANYIKDCNCNRIPNQHDSAGRVLSSHVYESCAVLKQDYGHMGYKGRRPIQVLSLSHSPRAARHQLIETLPATRIRRMPLRTSVSKRAIYQVVITLYGRIQKQFRPISLSFLPDAAHHRKYFALCVEPGMFSVLGSLQ